MKVCVTCIRVYDSPIGFKVIDKLVDEMLDAGMPEEMANDLIEKSKALWIKERDDHHVIFAAEIIDKDSEN